jgi:hypothetical protein
MSAISKPETLKLVLFCWVMSLTDVPFVCFMTVVSSLFVFKLTLTMLFILLHASLAFGAIAAPLNPRTNPIKIL